MCRCSPQQVGIPAQLLDLCSSAHLLLPVAECTVVGMLAVVPAGCMHVAVLVVAVPAGCMHVVVHVVRIMLAVVGMLVAVLVVGMLVLQFPAGMPVVGLGADHVPVAGVPVSRKPVLLAVHMHLLFDALPFAQPLPLYVSVLVVPLPLLLVA